MLASTTSTLSLEGIRRLDPCPDLFALLFPRGIFAQRDQLARFLAPPARLAQANFGIGANGQQFFAPIDAKLEPPEFAPGWRDQQEHAAPVR